MKKTLFDYVILELFSLNRKQSHANIKELIKVMATAKKKYYNDIKIAEANHFKKYSHPLMDESEV